MANFAPQPATEARAAEGSATRPRETVGDLLRRAREEQGVSIESIAAQLRIREAYLAAIEQARYDRLPGAVYALGFVRTYANYLGLDGEEAVRRFKLEAAGLEQRRDLTFPMPLTQRGIPGRGMVLIALILAICAYGIWHFVLSDRSRPERVAAVPTDLLPPPPPAPAPSEAAPAAATPGAPASVPAPQGGAPAATPPTAAAAAPSAPGGETAPSASATPPAAPTTPVTSTALPPPAGAASGSLVAPPPPPLPSGALAQNGAPSPAVPPQTAVAPPAPGATAPATPPAASAAPASAGGPETPPAAAGASGAAATPAAPSAPHVYGAINGPSHITIKAVQDCWIQVRDEDTQDVVAQRTLHTGDTYRVPDRSGLVLRAGNASALQVTVDDKQAPALGGTVRNLALDPARLMAGTAVIE
jgi:cytoskeleton protein RodZ